jgi:hypothetical protein
MSTKKRVSYQKLLKEAISEYDTSKTVDVKGPMLDPILSYAGGGELPTHKDAASILERYYFKEEADNGVEINDKGEDGKGMDHAEGTGTEQAGTSDKSISGTKKEIEGELAKESKRLKGKAIREEEDKEEDKKEDEKKDEVPPSPVKTESKKRIREEEEKKEDEKKEDDEKKDEEVAMENAIIEKLIAEMEDEDKKEPEEDKKEDEKEEAIKEGDAPDYEGDGVKPGMEAPKEKEAKTSMDDAQGAGTQQAGTGDANGQVPSRKDVADSFVKPAQLEAEEVKDAEPDADEDDKDLDVDKAIKEANGSVMPPSMQKKVKHEDQGAELQEIFRLFKEEIEAEGDDDDESDAAEEDDKEDEGKK